MASIVRTDPRHFTTTINHDIDEFKHGSPSWLTLPMSSSVYSPGNPAGLGSILVCGNTAPNPVVLRSPECPTCF
jgi:hypothetical protein